MKTKIWLLPLLLLLAMPRLDAQVLEPVKWTFSVNRLNDKTVEVIAEATIDNNWHLYSTEIPDGGPIATSLNINPSDDYVPTGSLQVSPEPKPSFDEAFQMELGYFSKTARIVQQVEIKGDLPVTISGYVEFMACDDHRCLPPDQAEFELKVTSESAAAPSIAAIPGNDSDSDKESAWGIFWLAFLGGLAALLTPCVFPMIPLTVSFFIRNADNRAKALRDGFANCATIILA